MSGPRIEIVDYAKGNLASMQRSLAAAGFDAHISTDPADIRRADGIVLPGVGAFSDAMTTMNETGLSDAVRDRVCAGIPFLGVCLGLHLLFEWGDEGCADGERMAGLGLLPGHVERMAAFDEAGEKYKIPHVGWNSVDYVGDECPLFAGVDDGSYFYFTHSYCAVPDDSRDSVGMTTHARSFTSAVARETVFGAQFHPEKSSDLGLRVLVNFGRIVEA